MVTNKIFISIFLMFVSLFSMCTTRTSENKVQDFYRLAEDENIDVFFNLTLIARNFNSQTKRYDLARVVSERIVNGITESLDLPFIRCEMKISDIEKVPFYSNIEVYAKQNGITQDSVKRYLIKVSSLYDKLKVINIISRPDLGKFIRFKISSDEDVIYLPDVSLVYNDYWNNFFQSSTKLKAKWYFRKVITE